MQIILLSGGSGKRLWPLSNSTRSKQFLKMLSAPDGGRESMVQRMARQIGDSHIDAELTIATSASQQDSIRSQLGYDVGLVCEPSRRDTFPAIALSCMFLAKARKLGREEIVVVVPCDTYTGSEYFDALGRMAQMVASDSADLVLMGVTPTTPSSKFGYIVPDSADSHRVRRFVEKPRRELARQLIAEGAMWNAGVFAFRLGFIEDIVARYVGCGSFEKVLADFDLLPAISFDYEVVEKTDNVGFVRMNDGAWKDLGTWPALTSELAQQTMGNASIVDTRNTTVINELNIPMVCIGTRDLIVAASPDGILVANKDSSDKIKDAVEAVERRPMYEERRWGVYKVVDTAEFADGFRALTKQLTLNPGCSISYQRHACRDEVWTFIDGEGVIVLDDVRMTVGRGDVIRIPRGQRHALKAVSELTFIEVQSGSNLVEEDIERFDFSW